MMRTRTASCACGQLCVSCRGEPETVSLCHCLACQKRTGSPFGIAAFFPREDVRTEGRASTYSRSSDSGFAVNFHFCPDYGSTVLWEPEWKPAAIAVAVGSFADPSFPPPTLSAGKDRRHPWVTLSN
ncbi:MAG: GFA family protein [Alphaproteobacteria bacterium]